jgi:hypothetical protein
LSFDVWACTGGPIRPMSRCRISGPFFDVCNRSDAPHPFRVYTIAASAAEVHFVSLQPKLWCKRVVPQIMASVIRGGIFEYTINPISESICIL